MEEEIIRNKIISKAIEYKKLVKSDIKITESETFAKLDAIDKMLDIIDAAFNNL